MDICEDSTRRKKRAIYEAFGEDIPVWCEDVESGYAMWVGVEVFHQQNESINNGRRKGRIGWTFSPEEMMNMANRFYVVEDKVEDKNNK